MNVVSSQVPGLKLVQNKRENVVVWARLLLDSLGSEPEESSEKFCGRRRLVIVGLVFGSGGERGKELVPQGGAVDVQRGGDQERVLGLAVREDQGAERCRGLGCVDAGCGVLG